MFAVLCVGQCSVFLFKQKTAYEKRISDWSSDVCSSDLFRPFNRAFDRGSLAYVGGVQRVIRRGAVAGLTYAGLLGLTWFAFDKLPAGFVPAQDKYYLVGIVQLPNGASLDRTQAVAEQVRPEEHTPELPSLMRHSYAAFFLTK